MPNEIALAFEVLAGQVQFDDFVSLTAKPLHVERHFPLAGSRAHLARDNELPNFFVASHEDLVGGKNHIFEIFDGVNGFHLQP